MQTTRGLAFIREGTEMVYEQVPIDFYDTEVFKTKTSDHKSIEDVYSQGKLVKRLKAEKSYAQITPVKTKSNVYFNVNSIRSITRESESPLVEKIHLSSGREIEFRLENGQMDIYSRAPNSQTYSISKKLQTGLSYEEALKNAEGGILGKLTRHEIQSRANETNFGILGYLKRDLVERLKKQKEKTGHIDAETLRQVQSIIAMRDSEFMNAA